MAELLLYSPLYNFSAESVVKELGRIETNEDVLFRINSPGGSTSAGLSIVSRISEMGKRPSAVIDGNAYSMAAFMLPFFDKVTANDTSEIMFHKAAYPSWYQPTEAESQSLKRQNKAFESKLRAKVEGKHGSESFLAKVFEADVRNDVYLTAYEAKELGIVDEVRVLEPNAYLESGNEVITVIAEKKSNSDTKIKQSKKMEIKTVADLKAAYPVLASQMEASAEEKARMDERDRVQAWLVNVDVDAKAVAEGIDSGKDLSRKAQAEFDAKYREMNRTSDMTDENADPKAGAGKVEHKTAEQLKIEADLKAIEDEFAK